MTFLLIAMSVSMACLTGSTIAPAAMFVGAAVAHDVMFGAHDGLAYYGSAALFDLVVIFGISRLSEISEFSLQIQKLSVLSIFLNLYGWAAWFAYLSPIAYNYAYVALYGWALLLFVIGGWPSVGIRADSVRDSRFFSTCRAWRSSLLGHRG